ncbi:MAG TPA: nuclear transport factor 2 family protein [Alphaproteobacteria bacterium]
MFKETVERYVQQYATFSPQKVEQLKQFLGDNFTFNDPFHSDSNMSEYVTALKKMFAQVKEPVFQIRKLILDENDSSALISWDLTGSVLGKPLQMQGLSKLIGDAKGLLTSQTDYWDISPLRRIGWTWPLKTALAWQMISGSGKPATA